jgi:hypothetical protein
VESLVVLIMVGPVNLPVAWSGLSIAATFPRSCDAASHREADCKTTRGKTVQGQSKKQRALNDDYSPFLIPRNSFKSNLE